MILVFLFNFFSLLIVTNILNVILTLENISEFILLSSLIAFILGGAYYREFYSFFVGGSITNFLAIAVMFLSVWFNGEENLVHMVYFLLILLFGFGISLLTQIRKKNQRE